MDIDHLCRVRHCVAPLHLEVVTRAENTRRGNAGLHQRVKTHCPAGHAYDAENTRLRGSGRRVCLTCTREQARKASQRYRERKRADTQR